MPPPDLSVWWEGGGPARALEGEEVGGKTGWVGLSQVDFLV